MEILINKRKWSIHETAPDDSMLIADGNRCKGTTHYYHHAIYINKEMRRDDKLATLRHELTHAFIYETQICDKSEYSEEELCDLVGIYGAEITDIAYKYFGESEADNAKA